MESKQIFDSSMLEEFVALYLREKDVNLEKSFREKIGVSLYVSITITGTRKLNLKLY